MQVTAFFLFLVVLFLSLLSPYRIQGKLQTVFVDDKAGDSLTGALPAFLPSEAGFSQGPLCHGCGDSWCQGCALQPDPAQAHGGTWMVATHFKNDPAKYITFDFEGTEVTVFCIVPNPTSPSNVVTRYSLDFRIDLDIPPNGQTIYDHESDSSGTYQYNVAVFHQTGLPNTKHTMMIREMRSDIDSVLLFDYATYVHDDGLPDSTEAGTSPSPPTTTSHTTTSHTTTSQISVESTLSQSSPGTTVPPRSSITSLTTSSTISLNSSSPTSSGSSIPVHNQTTASDSPLTPTTSTSAPATKSSSIDPPSPNTSHPSKHLPAILGSVFGVLLVLLLGAFLIHRLRVRRRPSEVSSSNSEVNPFSQQTPSIPKNRRKSRYAQQASSNSAPLSSSTTHLVSDEAYEESTDEPPTYSRDGFQFD